MPPDPLALRKKKLPICFTCKCEISGVHFKCAQCPEDIDLCIECLVKGEEAPEIGHRREHSYRVQDNLASFSLFEKDWTAQDEIALLEGVDTYGMGNWRDISTYIGTKTDQQCSKHYMAAYLTSPTAPLPSPVLIAPVGTDGTGAGAAGGSGAAGAPRNPLLGPTALSRAGGHVHASSAYSTAHVPRVDIAGYMPLRGDFDVEHDNDAEQVLADLDFHEGEHGTETELKLKILEIYNSKLDERERRKAFIIERGLLDYKRLLSMERRRPKEEREVYNALRPFARFLTPSEWEDLVRGIILEHRLRKRIAQLQEYRRAGITSLAEAAEYEATKKRRAAESAMKRKSATYLFETVASDTFLPHARSAGAAASFWTGGASSYAGAGAGGRGGRGARSSRLDASMSAGGSSSAGGLSVPAAGKRRRAGGGWGYDDPSPMASGPPLGMAEGAGGPMASSQADGTPLATTSAGVLTGSALAAASAAAAAAAAGERAGAASAANASPFILANMPGAKSLSVSERAVCEALRLTPAAFGQIKGVLVNTALVRGAVGLDDLRQSMRSVTNIQVGALEGVYQFVVSAGIVTPKAIVVPPELAPTDGGAAGAGTGGVGVAAQDMDVA